MRSRHRAFVEALNPLLACSNPGGRLEQALRKLELLVSIDLFRNEVGDLAHYVLPATTWLERPEAPYALQSFAGCNPTPYMIYADRDPRAAARRARTERGPMRALPTRSA